MDEQQRELEELIRKMQDATATTEDFARANKAAEHALTRFTKTSLSDLTRGVTAFGGSVMDGNRSFQSLSPVVDSLTKVVASAAKAIPVVGKALGAAAEAAGAGFNFLIGQLDQTIQAFQQVSQTGAIGADGMSAFRDQAFSSLMTLSQFSDAVSNNSQALAKFGGATFASTQLFSESISAIAGPGGFARRLGRTTSDIADTTAKFMEMQVTQGRQQMFTGSALKKGTEDYILDLDKLSRLTGQSARELQDQQMALMLDQQFAAFTGNMGEQGQLLAKFVSSTGPLADGFKDIIATGGAATTDAGRQLQVLLGGAANDIAMSLRSADDIPGAIARVRSILDANLEVPRTAAAAGVQNFLTDNFGAIQLFARGLTQSNEEIEASRQGALTGTNQLTASMTKAAENIDAFAANLEGNVISKLLPGTAGALQGLTAILNQTIEFIGNMIDRVNSGKNPIEGEGEDLTMFSKFMNYFTGSEADTNFQDRMTGAGVVGGAGALVGGAATGGFLSLPAAIVGALTGFLYPAIARETRQAIESMSRYMGGPVTAGQPYLVGERGTEAFIPDRDGAIIPNNMLAGPMTGFKSMNVPDPQPVQQAQGTDIVQTPEPVDIVPPSLSRRQETQNQAQIEMTQATNTRLDEVIKLLGRQISATDKVRTAVS